MQGQADKSIPEQKINPKAANAAYEDVNQALKKIKETLLRCVSETQLRSLTARYNELNLSGAEFQSHLKTNAKARTNIIQLERDIVNLMAANKRLYETTEQITDSKEKESTTETENNPKAAYTAYEEVKEELKKIKDTLQHCDNATQFHSLITSYNRMNLQETKAQEHIQAHAESRAKIIQLLSDIVGLIKANTHLYATAEVISETKNPNEPTDPQTAYAAYEEVKEGLKKIKEALQHCDNAAHFHVIVASYCSINVRETRVQEHIRTNTQSRTKIILLESEIASLIEANKKIYGTTEVLTSTVDKKIVVETAPKNAEKAKSPIKATTKPQEPITDKPQKPAATIYPQSAPATPEEENRQQKTTQFSALRKTQLSEFNKYLQQLAAKREQFYKEYPNDLPENPHQIYGAMNLLVQSLQQSAKLYQNGAIDLDQFKSDTTQAIRDKRNGVISKHRGYKELLTNLLLAIGTLGIGYAFAALFTQSLKPIKINTDSANKLDEMQKTINKLHP